jgi:hypothetical protein
MTTKTKNPSIRYIVNVGYSCYAFDTVEKAARLVDLLTLATPIETDYYAPPRDDRARTYCAKDVTTVAEIEAANIVINYKETPGPF